MVPPMRRGRSDLRFGIVHALAALALLLSFAGFEVHLASHQAQACAELGVEAHNHLSHPTYLETAPPSLDRRCFVCLLSSQRRAPLSDLPGVLPEVLAAGAADAGEYPVLVTYSVPHPVPRGPPSLL
jgi:hypothetical protein